MHPYELMNKYDLHHNAWYTVLYFLRGHKPCQADVEAKCVSTMRAYILSSIVEPTQEDMEYAKSIPE